MMREVCFVNSGESVLKLKYKMNVSTNSIIEEDKLFNHRYITLENGEDDITVVRNYSPYYLIKNTINHSLLDIYAMGYELLQGDDSEELTIIKKLDGVRYIVKPMEKLDDISFKLGVSKQEIMVNNSLKTDKLFVGQILII